MTHDSVPSANSPRELLTAVSDLTRRVRVAQRGTWFPLLVFAVITLVAIPVERYAPQLGPCQAGPEEGTLVCAASVASTAVYWPVALMLAYAAIAVFYVRQSRQRGLGTPIRPYVVVGVVLAVLLAGASLWLAYHPLAPFSAAPSEFTPTMHAVSWLASPLTVIGFALLVLAWVERHWALLAYTAVYLVIGLVQGGQVIQSSSRWFFLPYLLVPAVVLLLGSAAFALFRPVGEAQPR